MIILNHTTRFGNSFNLLFFQHILQEEYGLRSVYRNGENFASYFSESVFDQFCSEENLNHLSFGPVFSPMLSGQHVSEQKVHSLTKPTSRGFQEGLVEGVKIISTETNLEILPDDLISDFPLILNRAHYIHLPNMVDLRKKHQDSFRERLVFNDQARSKVNVLVREQSSRENKPKYVGLHMRRTDYKDYLGGKYYFDIEDYSDFAKNFLINCPHESLVFIFTDDPDSVASMGSESVRVVAGSQMEDFVTMTKMDLLVGPPSSFANAASFLGKVSRHIVRSVDHFSAATECEKLLSKKWYPHLA